MDFKLKQMRILIGSYYLYPNSGSGGAEKQGYLLAKALRELGVSVSYVTARMPGQSAYEVMDNIPVYRVFAGTNFRLGPFRPWVFYLGLKSFLLKNGKAFDIFQAQGAWEVVAPAMTQAAHALGKKAIVRHASINDVDRLRSIFVIGRRLSTLLIKADKHITNSELTYKEMVVNYGLPEENCLIIPNMIEIPIRQDKKTIRRQLQLPISAIIICCVSNFHKGKNQIRLINAWPEIVRAHSTARLIFLGKGVEENICKNEAKRLGVQESIVFAGYSKQVKEYLSASDLFVFPSGYEGQSNALLEAMAIGLPIAVADTPMNRLSITPDIEAIGFDPKKTNEIITAINMLIGNSQKAQAFGIKAQQRIVLRHNPKTVAKQFMDLYQAVLT
jgi:glycosyltransferase involved in cell wall biosynthesis